VIPLRRIANRRTRHAATTFGLAAVLFGLAAAPALAAPAFEVGLSNSAPSEVQSVKVDASAGQYRLSFGAGGPGVSETADISVTATALQLQSALNAITSVSTGGGSVTVSGGPGNAGGTAPYVVTFNGGPLARTNVPPMTVAAGATPLSGGVARVTVSTTQEGGVSRSDERVDYTATVKNIGANSTDGTPVTAKIELPNSPETYVLSTTATGWTCTTQVAAGGSPAKATCTRSDALAPGASYPPIAVATALGEDAPDSVLAKAKVSGGGAVEASATNEFTFAPPIPFGIASFNAAVRDPLGNNYTNAGGHPYSALAAFALSKLRNKENLEGFKGFSPTESARVAAVDAARGFVGNALAAPQLCPTVEMVTLSTCPTDSAVGGIEISFRGLSLSRPIYSIEPEFGQPAEFAFGTGQDGGKVLVVFTPHLRANEGYAISFESAPIFQAPELLAATPILCAFGANLTGGGNFVSCKKNEPSENPSPHPLITNPTRCTGAISAGIRVNSWQHQAAFKTAEYPLPSPTNCGAVPFEPKSELAPTNHQADSPTGLGVEFTMPTEGLLQSSGCHEKQGDPSSPAAECVSQANLDTASVTFPKGMSINPAAADGLGACSLEQVKLKSNAEAECPESSKVGTIEIDTPIIRKTLTGNVYVAQQNHNPFNSTLGLYMVFSSARDGITIKVAGKLVTDPDTGQLTSVFTENPEAPFSRLALHFNEGPRAPLINPPKCGSYAIHSEFSPWSAANPANPTPAETVSQDSAFEVTEGPNGGPCPAGNLEVKLKSGLDNPTAGAKSPFVLTLSREDGSQRFTALDVATPKGLTAYLKGIPYCPDAVLAGISGAEETGRPELANPSCPSASQVGTVLAGAGSGPFPFQTPGKVYLAGPYKGAPVSLAVVTPAVAGPFDLGNVVIRNALYVDPETAQVTAKSDPIPTILHGILLDVRQIRLALDRPNFTAAPTNCEAMSVDAHVTGELGASANLFNRFQVGNCAALGFKPKLALRLFGGTKRGSHPRLVAKLTARAGDANIAGASVALPHSEFLDQAHIRTICTRVQFAAHACPQGAIYGEAEAITPLLDNPVKGPVYLRSSDNPLPDLVAALRGPDGQPIEVVLSGRIDSVHGGIRSSFDTVPDQPVSSFTLRMQGGKKGLLVNSRDICKSVNKANAVFSAQNGRRATLRPVLQNSCKKKHKHKHHARPSGR